MLFKNHKTDNFVLTISILFIFVIFCNAQSLVDPFTPANIMPEGFDSDTNLKLSFSDEFELKGMPNSSKWVSQNYNRRNNPDGSDGWWSSEDSYMEEGNLIIRLRTIPNNNADNDTLDYSCGAIHTKGKFEQLYGIYEIRCKLPKKQGWWVAFWMMQGNVSSVLDGGVNGSEVDIFEGFGWGNKINLAIHWDGYGTEHKKVSEQIFDAKYYEGYHTYTLEWNPTEYVFFIDGIKVWTTIGGGVCNHPGYLLVTGEISTLASLTGTGWANLPVPSSYPDYFGVDYVRVWKSTQNL